MVKIFRIAMLLVSVVFFQSIHAQRVINKELNVNNNLYHISMDERIDTMLLQTEESCRRSVYMDEVTDTKPFNKEDICKESPKLIGYKIQVAIVRNGSDANKIRYELRQKFPDLSIEVDTNIRPNHKILAGSYFSKESGNSDLERVKKVFRNAVLVSYRVFCEESI